MKVTNMVKQIPMKHLAFFSLLCALKFGAKSAGYFRVLHLRTVRSLEHPPDYILPSLRNALFLFRSYCPGSKTSGCPFLRPLLSAACAEAVCTAPHPKDTQTRNSARAARNLRTALQYGAAVFFLRNPQYSRRMIL